MHYGETIVRFFLPGEEPGYEVLLAEVSYQPYENITAIIPRKGEHVFLDDIMRDDVDENNRFDFYTVQMIEYAYGPDKDILADITVRGEEFTNEE